MKYSVRKSPHQHQISAQNETSGLIQSIDADNAHQAVITPQTTRMEDQPWLQRYKLKKQMAQAHRHALVGGARIAAERQLSTMRIAAEAVVKMAERQWEGLVQLHGTRATKEFASIFLEMQNEFMEEVCTATATIENRAAAEAARIEASNHPDFVKVKARERNEDRFFKEIAAVEAIADRIGELLSTRLGQHDGR